MSDIDLSQHTLMNGGMQEMWENERQRYKGIEASNKDLENAFLFRITGVYSHVVCVCVYACMHVCTSTCGGQRSALPIFLSTSLCYLLRQSLPLNL